MRGTLVLASALALGGCDLYFGADDATGDDVGDDAIPLPDAAWVPPDADTGCAEWLSCQADPSQLNVCGWILDVAWGARVSEPASLQVVPYDLLALADPNGTTPEPLEHTVTIDSCGRYALHVVSAPASGLVAVVVDDAADVDDHVPTVVAFRAGLGTVVNYARTFALRRVTDERWASAVALPGSTVERGAVLMTFQRAQVPIEGVTPTIGGDADPARTYAFADTDPLRRTMLTTGDVTGANGSALVVGDGMVDLVAYSGQGGLPPMDSWAEKVAGTIAGTLWVVEIFHP